MFCLYCTEYQGLNTPCHKGKNVLDIQEVLECKDYQYNQGCESE